MSDKTTFVKLDRNILKWGWYTDTPTKALFLHLILTANVETKKWQDIVIKRGQVVTSIQKLSSETGLSVRQVRTALNHLNSTNEVTQSSTTRYTLITLTNYDRYQDKATSQTTNKRQTSDKRATNDRQQLKKDNTKVLSKKEITNVISKNEKKGADAPGYVPHDWEREIPEEFRGEFESIEAFREWWES